MRMKCCQCKKNWVLDLQSCCSRYICDDCHRQHCKLYVKNLEIQSLKSLVSRLHAALNDTIAGKTLDPLDKEDLDADVNLYC